MIETWFNQEINEPVKVRYLDGNVFSQDNNGNKIGVNLFLNSEPENVSGSISASVIRADGVTVSVSGYSSANQAWVVLPQSAYSVPGVLSIVIKSTENGDITTLCAVIANVYQSSTDSVVDPGTIIPSIQTLIDEIESAVASIPADYSSLWESLAPVFDSSTLYKANDVVVYDGAVYKFNKNHSGSWSSSDVTQITIGGNFQKTYENLHSVLVNQPVDILKIDNIFVDEEHWGVMVTYDPAKGQYTANGTASANDTVFWNVINEKNIPNESIKRGKRYHLVFTSTDGNFYAEWFQMASGSVVSTGTTTAEHTIITIGDSVDQFIVRLRASSGKTFTNAIMTIGLYDCDKSAVYMLSDAGLPTGTDINSIVDPGIFPMIDNRTYPHSPLVNGEGGVLYVYGTLNKANIINQIIFGTTYNRTFTRTRFASTWTAWRELDFYISSTGDTTDRTAEIQGILDTFGVCRLGEGMFYTTGLTVPNNGILQGSGNKTILTLADSVTSGHAVRLLNHGRVCDMLLQGATSDITVPSSVGTRHGVLFEGNADAQTDPTTNYRSAVTNCFIRRFTGGGITMKNTGYEPGANLLISDCFVRNCGAGINIAYFSEFSRITNVTCQECRYGCIDNGGNNNFANCDFSSNYVGLLIDNSQDQSPNNTHGSFVGCTFNHSGANTGTAIRILKGTAGEIFTASQIFYGGIDIDESVGVRFIGANFGRNTPISVTDSSVVVFSDCTFLSSDYSPVTQSGNTRLSFEGCYLRDGTVFNPIQ